MKNLMILLATCVALLALSACHSTSTEVSSYVSA
jgi:hypothetical protein